MKRLSWRVALVVIVLACAVLACRIDWGGGVLGGENVTATYGAQQWGTQEAEMNK